jgi:hypothetical protein
MLYIAIRLADGRPRLPGDLGWSLFRGPLQWQRLIPDRYSALERTGIRWLLWPWPDPRLR